MKNKKAPVKQKKVTIKGMKKAGILGLAAGATSKFFKMPASRPTSTKNEFVNLLPTVNVRPKKKNLIQKLFSFKK
tara:strand:+ start:1204 stop:1428 length:225 start_codon:yes stop_codon:yes gene_type:complete